MEEVVKTFLQYGVVGLVALLGLWFGYRKDQELKEERNDHKEAMAKKNAEIVEMQNVHRKEMEVLHERHSVKAETWVQQYFESDDKKTDALQAVEQLVTKLLSKRLLTEDGET